MAFTSPYGSWNSPITSSIVSASEKQLSGSSLDSNDRLLWVESRPNESGRDVLVRQGDKPGDELIDVISKEFEVKTTNQEYGGKGFTVFGDTLVFSNHQDQRLYKYNFRDSNDSPAPITPDYGGPVVRFADGVFCQRFNTYITVMEDHRESETNPVTKIAVVKLDSGDIIEEPKVLVSGSDFYVFPRIDPSGERLAWVEWSHPNMHWDKAELWVGYIADDGEIKRRVCVAGGDPSIRESPTEPKWSPKGELFFVTDRRNGYWNIYKWVEHENMVIPVYPMDAEFSRPLWVTGISSYGFIKNSENLLACSYRHKGKSYIGILDEMHQSFSVLDVSFSDISNIVCDSNCLYLEGASETLPLSIAKVVLDVGNSKVIDSSIIWSSSPDSTKYKSYFSLPEFIEFPTNVKEQNAYAYFYPPLNIDYQASREERPPLLLRSHGGPTDEARAKLDLNIQYWTSRGWAFVDVNYGGSSGYGREFRERLLRHWGIVDVDDCCSCAQFLVETGKVDAERLCITGGSAGGYTTLSSLAFKQIFKAGSSLYGICDLKSLKEEMPKFESHYIDNLVGNEDAYFQRSPINFINQFSCPVILFQGLDDKIVQPNQARKMHTALKQKGLPVAIVEYEGEGHGFHKGENLKFTLEQEMMFFARTVGHFKVADHIIPIEIDNLD